MVAGSLEFDTLELPWFLNAKNISCIPTGTYRWVRHKSHSKGWSLWITNVPERSEVMMHVGNYPKNSRGCILVGASVLLSREGQPIGVGHSAKAMRALLSLVGDSGVLTVESGLPKEVGGVSWEETLIS